MIVALLLACHQPPETPLPVPLVFLGSEVEVPAPPAECGLLVLVSVPPGDLCAGGSTNENPWTWTEMGKIDRGFQAQCGYTCDRFHGQAWWFLETRDPGNWGAIACAAGGREMKFRMREAVGTLPAGVAVAWKTPSPWLHFRSPDDAAVTMGTEFLGEPWNIEDGGYLCNRQPTIAPTPSPP